MIGQNAGKANRVLLAVADRILVMRDAEIVAERDAASTSDHELIILAGGSETDDEDPAVSPIAAN